MNTRPRISRSGLKYVVRLDSAQSSPLGKILHWLYYAGGRPLNEQAPDRFGNPHEGGQHILRIKGKKKDLLSWMELVLETYPKKRKQDTDDLQAIYDALKLEKH